MNLIGAFERVMKNGLMTESGCFEYQGSRNRHGYGTTTIWDSARERRLTFSVHRLVMIAKHGPIRPQVFVCHRCDNPRCFNVDHLFLGSHRENLADAVKKGRMSRMSRGLGSKNGMAKLSEVSVREIKRRLKTGESARLIGIEFGVGRSTIAEINRGATWRQI